MSTYPVEDASTVALSASGAGGGLREVEFTVTFGALGAPTLVTNRPDIVGSVVRNVLGVFTVTYAQEFPSATNRALRVDGVVSGSFWIALAAVPASAVSDSFAIYDATGTLVDPDNGTSVHVTVRYTVDGSAF